MNYVLIGIGLIGLITLINIEINLLIRCDIEKRFNQVQEMNKELKCLINQIQEMQTELKYLI